MKEGHGYRMFEFRVITIFPELFESFREASLIGKAGSKELLKVKPIDLRDFTDDRHRTVDDAPYGGGSGMVMKAEPIFKALEKNEGCHKVLLTPQGAPLTQKIAHRLAGQSPLLLFCGRYEGVDERARGAFDEEISIGDFVLNGGEVAAMAVIEVVSRLIPGVLGNSESIVEESFSLGALEYPQYTRPEMFDGASVPHVLLSGNHKRVQDWRRGQALLRTRDRRPDLFEKLELSQLDRNLLEQAIEDKDK